VDFVTSRGGKMSRDLLHMIEINLDINEGGTAVE
jgi:hypothetical protein